MIIDADVIPATESGLLKELEERLVELLPRGDLAMVGIKAINTEQVQACYRLAAEGFCLYKAQDWTGILEDMQAFVWESLELVDSLGPEIRVQKLRQLITARLKSLGA